MMMDRFSTLEKQHREIKEYIGILEISASVEKLAEQGKARELRKNLSLLAGKLKIHMQREDKFLYPDLLQSDNQEVKRTTEKFIAEMGDLDQVFSEFNRKYLRYSEIKENAVIFVSELKIILQKLKQRIEREDNKLYTLI